MTTFQRTLVMLAALLLTTAAQAGGGDIEARIRELRTDLAEAGDATSPLLARRRFLERQLLTSMERRRDLARVGDEISTPTALAPAATAPAGLVALDDLRRAKQQVDAALALGTRRLDILRADRDAAAAQLARGVAQLRQVDADDAGTLSLAKLDVELAESTTAELDAFIGFTEKQQSATQGRADMLASQLAGTTQPLRPTDTDVAALEARLAAKAERSQARLAAAAAEREAARQALAELPADASEARLRTRREQLATGDFALELAREASSNLATEEAAWRLALAWWRDGDTSAPVAARERAPVTLSMLERRLDYLRTVSEFALGQIGALDARIALADATDLDELKAQRATFEQRLAALQSTTIDQRELIALIARLRADFEARGQAAGWRERASLAWAALRAFAASTWHWELLTVDETVDVDGRKTSVPRSVTVGKLIKAPLLLVVGLFLAFRLTAWHERRARRRGVDEARARLVRRWTLGLLALGCGLLSLVLAGIPFAVFAFAGGAIAIGVGFGMQTLLKNLISGVIVLVERPFRLGDQIEMGSLRGTVVDINLRTSVLRDGDGSETLVPNSALIDNNVRNYTFRTQVSRQTLEITVASDSDTRAAAEALRDAAHRHGQLVASKEPQVYLDDVTTDGLRYTLHYWIELGSGIDRRRVASDLRLMTLGALAEAGVRLAEPALDVRLSRAAA